MFDRLLRISGGTSASQLKSELVSFYSRVVSSLSFPPFCLSNVFSLVVPLLSPTGFDYTSYKSTLYPSQFYSQSRYMVKIAILKKWAAKIGIDTDATAANLGEVIKTYFGPLEERDTRST